MDYQSQIYLFREKLFHVITIFHARARNKFPFLFKFLNANFEVARNFYLASSVLPRSSVQIFIDNSANFCSRRGGRRERNFREPRVSLSEYFDEWGEGGGDTWVYRRINYTRYPDVTRPRSRARKAK